MRFLNAGGAGVRGQSFCMNLVRVIGHQPIFGHNPVGKSLFGLKCSKKKKKKKFRFPCYTCRREGFRLALIFIKVNVKIKHRTDSINKVAGLV